MENGYTPILGCVKIDCIEANASAGNYSNSRSQALDELPGQGVGRNDNSVSGLRLLCDLFNSGERGYSYVGKPVSDMFTFCVGFCPCASSQDKLESVHESSFR
jgi:hypothetical protein